MNLNFKIMVMFYEHCCVAALLISLVLPEIACATGMGKCPKVQYMTDFNVTRFAGRWFEIERTFYLMELISTCVTVELIQNTSGKLEVEVRTKSRWSGSFTISEGVASPTKRSPSLLSYKVVTNLPKVFSRYLPGAGIYQIVDTDYDNFAILWSCTNYDIVHTDLIWIWGRQIDFTATQRAKIYRILEFLNLDSERLILPKNRNCT